MFVFALLTRTCLPIIPFHSAPGVSHKMLHKLGAATAAREFTGSVLASSNFTSISPYISRGNEEAK